MEANMAPDVEEWSYLWEELKDHHVLLDILSTRDGSLSNCLIFNSKERSFLLIEDNELAGVVKERMARAGVPIVPKDEYPLQVSDRERLLNEMLESGKSPREINAALKAFKG